MLNGIHIVDFGNHRDTELRFGAFTALVGQNGAGKTNVMRAIMELNKAVKYMESRSVLSIFDKVEPFDFDTEKFTRIGTNQPKLTAGWSGRFQDKEGDWGVEMGNWPKTWYWRARAAKNELPWIPEILDEGTDIKRGGILAVNEGQGVLGFMDWGSSYFKLLSERLRGPSYTEDNPPKLLENGKEFAWVLAYLMTAEPGRFREIMDALREVVPVVKNIRARPVRIARMSRKSVMINKQERTYDDEQAVMGQELIFDMVSGEGLAATFVSDGTLIVLAVLTAIIQGDSGAKTILLDDIEQGLHPKAQRDLIRQLRKLQEVRPELQIIVSSHSPYVVDELSPEDVWLFAPDKDGCAAYARLSDHPDVDQALKVLTTGEFWSSEGEDWVLDPQKRANHRVEQPA